MSQPAQFDFLLQEKQGVSRTAEPVRTGMPLPRGWLRSSAEASLCDADGQVLPAQFKPLAYWGDGSIKWLLMDALVSVPANGSVRLVLANSPGVSTGNFAAIAVNEKPELIEVDTGALRIQFARQGSTPVRSMSAGGRDLLDARGLRLRAIGGDGKEWRPVIRCASIEDRGAVRATIVCAGKLGPLEFKLRMAVHAGSAALQVECEIWNPRAARHPGGLWDLGDPGSVSFTDLSIEAGLADPSRGLSWRSQPGPWLRQDPVAWSLYQDSSGGEHWDSPNHVDRNSKLTVSFRGYQVRDASGKVVAQGERATPGLKVHSERGWMCVSSEKFWQNFPKALRWDEKSLSLGLFPVECKAGFELQGGEKKRHLLMFEFGNTDAQPQLERLHSPLEIHLDAAQVAASKAIANFLPQSADPHRRHIEFVDSILEGPHAFVAKREIIDEFGWRNFGDLYADHEAVNHRGPEPFISHYNNQYDFLYGAALNFLRSGDARWRELMVDAARHHIDIDIYHTREDRPAFNGGLFWHTDHYVPAKTSTHRTYSAGNAGGGPYGGGPSNEHDYTSGLACYYYLSGDPEARAAVIRLAEWVVHMDDGSLALLGLFDPGPTGAATATVEPNYQKPGRGAANSINALLDAFSLSGEKTYLAKAEEFIQRCIHPRDDIAALELSEPEHRWSYLVFLQVLGKYLSCKRELEEYDYAFHHARESLVHYATWMTNNEVPYKDVLHKMLLPTETWSAQDVRKGHVLQMASLYAPRELRAPMRERAEFFHRRCLEDLLSFPTAFLTRPQVLFCVYACQYSGAAVAEPPEVPPGNHDFGRPVVFVRRHRALGAAGARAIVALRAIRRHGADSLQRLFGRH